MHTPASIGKLVRSTRKALGISQTDLALVAGTRQRFVSELENGKPTCELGKALMVIQSLGIKIDFVKPKIDPSGNV